MPRVRAFFRLGAKDGLKSAQVIRKGREITFDASAWKEATARFRRRMLWGVLGLLALAVTSAVVGWRSGWLKKADLRPVMEDSREILRIIVAERSTTKLHSYLRDHRYRDCPDAYGWTALHWAAFLQDKEMMAVLQKSGASPRSAATREWFVFPKGALPADIARLSIETSMPAGAKQKR